MLNRVFEYSLQYLTTRENHMLQRSSGLASACSIKCMPCALTIGLLKQVSQSSDTCKQYNRYLLPVYTELSV